MAAGEGFEPSHTESESAVLPLHNPAVFLTNKYYYTHLTGFVNSFFCVFLKNFFPLTDPAARDGRRSRKGGQNQAAMRSAPVKYFFSGRYSSANTTAQRMMSGSM